MVSMGHLLFAIDAENGWSFKNFLRAGRRSGHPEAAKSGNCAAMQKKRKADEFPAMNFQI